MRYSRLGGSGLTVSAVGLGCVSMGRKVDAEAAASIVDKAIDCGITFFDTAAAYGNPAGASEEILGAALKRHRDDVIIATKFGLAATGPHAPGSRHHVARSLEASLRRLGTDYIDLYQLHVPDPSTPVEETIAALDDAVRAGKIRYAGLSNCAGWQLADAAWTARTRGAAPFIAAQTHYNLLHRAAEDDVIPACRRFDLGVIPYFPLQYGLLTGKYQRDTPPPAGTRLAREVFAPRLAAAPWDRIDALRRFAADRGVDLLDVAIGGLLAQPGVGTVIAGATSAEQVHANAEAVRWKPTAAELAELDRITAGESS
jgi:aryl-alcohol dehydrogenase-like predicted oxidoreductase